MEIERKFLILNDHWREFSENTYNIIQGYICSEPSHTVRVRIRDNQAWITVKGKTQGISREEIEVSIPIEKAQQLLNTFCHTKIIKARHIVNYKNHKWEIDEFFGRFQGLVVAEIELSDENENFEKPSWIGEEVSHKKEYFNSCLAEVQDTAFIEKHLSSLKSDLEKCEYLYNIYHSDMKVFFELTSKNTADFLPIIYTPTIGDYVMNYTKISLHTPCPRGLVISIEDADKIDDILNKFAGQVQIAVVTDGEGVLGIGDWGSSAINISIGKLMVYTLCGGIDPEKTLPIVLDVGTNNEKLLADPSYSGLKRTRAKGKEYDSFIDKFVRSFQKIFPKALLHWEDLGRDNAARILEKYRFQVKSFNDDIQGTGTVAMAAVLTGIKKSGIPLNRHKICILGAGTAGCGIADQLARAFSAIEKVAEAEIRKRFYLVDKNGLITERQNGLTDSQKPYAKTIKELKDCGLDPEAEISLLETVKHVHPTVLIGCAAAKDAFTREILEAMYSYCPKPIILPISNPGSKAEAKPELILDVTDGNALMAFGSPFKPADYKGEKISISQCNNSLGFPGIGLALIKSSQPYLTDNMLLAAGMALSDLAAKEQEPGSLLPKIKNGCKIAESIAATILNEG